MQHRYRNDSTRFRKACIFTTHKALRENTCPIASGDYSTPVSQRMTIEAKVAIQGVSMFLGYWFIKKAMWASQASLKSNAASLKKFYAFLLEKGLIEQEDLIELEETIKDEMPEWIEELNRSDDPSNFEDF